METEESYHYVTISYTTLDGPWSHIEVTYSINREMTPLFSDKRHSVNITRVDLNGTKLYLPIMGAVYGFEARTVSPNGIKSKQYKQTFIKS